MPQPSEGRTDTAKPRRAWTAAAMLRNASTAIRLWAAAALVGAAAGLVAVGFRELISLFEWIGTGHSGGLVATALALEWWQRLLVPLAGGLGAGLVLQWGARWARRGPRGDQHIDYLDAARSGEATLNDRTTLARSASALLSTGSGASIGREGPMVQMAAWAATHAARCPPSSARHCSPAASRPASAPPITRRSRAWCSCSNWRSACSSGSAWRRR
jgi:CIC family chloride channel protein